MSTVAHTIHSDHVWEVLEDRQDQELRFRSAMITSTAIHVGATLILLLAPLFIPKPQIFEFTPVNLVQLQPPEPAPAPPPDEEQAQAEDPEPEPEPEEIEPPPPEDVPEDLEAQRIAEEEEEARRREEERRRREEEEERRRLAEEARRRREAEERRKREEEERRRQPQKAARREAEPQQQEAITQQAERGEVGMLFGDEVSEADATLLQFWINRVLTNISNNWDPPPRPAGSRQIGAVIHFRVDRDGGLIVGPDVRAGSGNRRYDDAAVRAVRAGQPFPPLPQAYRGGTLAINLRFLQE